MKNVLALVIKKAIKNKTFIISVIIGCIITLMSLYYNVVNNTADIYQSSGETLAVQNPLYEMFTIYNHWIGGEPFSLGTSIYFFVFPILVAIPYGWSYCEEKNTGYIRAVVVQTGKIEYLLSKYIAVFASGGLTMTIPLIFNFLLSSLFFPFITPLVTYDTSYGVFGSSLMSSLYYTYPLIYISIYIIIDFVFCGLLACISMAVAKFIKYKWIVVISPFFVCLLINFSSKFIYTSPIKQYSQISPFYFLRPVQSGYAASWIIIIPMAFIILIVTFLIGILWERRNEIY